ncbi:phosphonate ABC transporter, periplasmic phosphonate-binding protein [Magnetococcus marinus MC-1]|uniref:Phosphonate ABC transporter, periplasmic phosphonate-binding protein n=1 Tax=Magnetococcus marinus (strain ATCC BAA-1437 / JCM 17883 / MC-1) TaxID=156889 RepID=A0L8Z3_MAGMM|nr:phosphate/phosphite/phosphonate ABC transporter substrate-binding protein [Magnetococcus marinus]ABK44436.1 phosphonate ABC transporter, periplasmic phosphonate-binding protein [Magnetococcus marinus MC-1]
MRLFRHPPWLILLVVLLACNSTLVLAAEPLIMGVFPRRNATTTYQMFTPLTNYLATHLGRPVRLITSKDFPSFWQLVEREELDLVHFNQLHYLRAHHAHGYNALAMNEEFGSSTIRGALVVRRQSGITHLSDLRGKTIIFGGGRSAMMSYVLPMHLLANAGLYKKDFTTRFAVNPPNAVLALVHKQAEAAGTGDVILNLPTVRSRVNTDDLTILARSAPVPHLPWATRGSMAPALRDQLRNILTTMKQDKNGGKVLQHAMLTNFISANDASFDPHREIVKQVLGEDL